MNIQKLILLALLAFLACAFAGPSPSSTGSVSVSQKDNLLNSAKETGSFNNCDYQFQGDSIKIYATASRDPGVYFQRIDRDVSKYKYFTFAIKGKLVREGQWCFPVVQIYDANDDEYTPSITKTSFSLKEDGFMTVSVPLEGKIKNLYKVQFILVTDKGSWNIEVKDPKLE
jgi:hypothetical protein